MPLIAEKWKAVQLNSDFWTGCPEVQKRGVLKCIFVRKKKHPVPPIAKLKVPDARRVLPKNYPVLIITREQGKYIRNSF
jgi:hypothetical protein